MWTPVAIITLIVAALSLGVSVLTAWLTLLRRGRIRMTQPTLIYLGPDGGPHGSSINPAKIYLKTLLFCTAARGRVIESMYVRVRRGETSQNFNIWVYGENSLQRGSGLFVPQGGVAQNHHFLPPNDGSKFLLLAGHYQLDMYAKIFGNRESERVFSTSVTVTYEMANQLASGKVGLYFDWGPDAGSYTGYVMEPPKREFPERFLDLLEGQVSQPNARQY